MPVKVKRVREDLLFPAMSKCSVEEAGGSGVPTPACDSEISRNIFTYNKSRASVGGQGETRSLRTSWLGRQRQETALHGLEGQGATHAVGGWRERKSPPGQSIGIAPLRDSHLLSRPVPMGGSRGTRGLEPT